MNRKWMPITAGILVILIGSFGILWGLLAMTLGTGFWLDTWSPLQSLLLMGLLMTVIGVLVVVGGVFGLRRKRWSLTTVGACMAIIPAFYLWDVTSEISILLVTVPAIIAIILTILSRKQFEK